MRSLWCGSNPAVRSLMTRPPGVGTNCRGLSSIMVLIPGWGSSVGGFLNTHVLFGTVSDISDKLLISTGLPRCTAVVNNRQTTKYFTVLIELRTKAFIIRYSIKLGSLPSFVGMPIASIILSEPFGHSKTWCDDAPEQKSEGRNLVLMDAPQP